MQGGNSCYFVTCIWKTWEHLSLASSAYCYWFSRAPGGLTNPERPHAGQLNAVEITVNVKKKTKPKTKKTHNKTTNTPHKKTNQTKKTQQKNNPQPKKIPPKPHKTNKKRFPLGKLQEETQPFQEPAARQLLSWTWPFKAATLDPLHTYTQKL